MESETFLLDFYILGSRLCEIPSETNYLFPCLNSQNLVPSRVHKREIVQWEAHENQYSSRPVPLECQPQDLLH